MAFNDALTLALRIVADASQGIKEVEKFKKELGGVDDVARKASGPLKGLGDTASGTSSSFSSLANAAPLAAAGFAAVAAGAVVVTKQLFDLATQSAAFSDSISEASDKTGLNTTAMQALKIAAEQSGSSFQGITNAVSKFNVLLGQAEAGNKKASSALAEYGVTARDTDTALIQAITSIAKMDSNMQQAAAATALFKDRTGEILPVIKSFDGDLPGLINKLEKLGVIMGEDDVKAGAAFQDQMDLLSTQLTTVANIVGAEVIPTFSRLFGRLSEWLAENRNELRIWAEVIGKSFESVITGASRLARLVSASVRGDRLAIVGIAGEISSTYDNVLQKQLDVERRNKALLDSVKGLTLKDVIAGSGRGASLGDDDGKKATDSRTDKQVYQDFVRELKSLGIIIKQGQGFRTFKEQADLFNSLPRGQAARPGTSDHEFFRAVDLPAGVSRELLEKAARAAGVVLEKQLVHQGTGLHNHQAFRKGQATGGGEAELEKENEERRKNSEKRLEEERKLNEQIATLRLQATESSLAQAFDLERSANKTYLADQERLFDDLLASGKIAAARKQAQIIHDIRVQMIRDEVAEQTRLSDAARKAADDAAKLADAEKDPIKQKQLKIEALKAEAKATAEFQKLQLKTIDGQNKEAESTRDLTKNINDATEAQTKRNQAWSDYVKRLLDAKDKEDELEARAQAEKERRAQEELDAQKQKEGEAIGGGLGGLLGSIGDALGIDIELTDKMTEVEATAARMKGVFTDLKGIAGDAIGSMVKGLGQLLVQWIVTGKGSAKAALEMAAGVAIGIAIEAGIKALFNVAEGFAALANPFTAYLAPGFFAAAKMYGIVAAAAGAVGVGLSFVARAAGGGETAGAAVGGSTASSTGRQQRNVEGQGRVYSSSGDETTITEAGINQAFQPMRHELTLHIESNDSHIVKAFQDDYKAGGTVRRLILSET